MAHDLSYNIEEHVEKLSLLEEVLEATSFKEHTATRSVSGNMVELGFHIGANIKLTRHVNIPSPLRPPSWV